MMDWLLAATSSVSGCGGGVGHHEAGGQRAAVGGAGEVVQGHDAGLAAWEAPETLGLLPEGNTA
jgi:hypothetical protein